MKTVKDFDVKGKKVLLRCDFNVPLNSSGNILDDFRMRKALPTIQYLAKNQAKVILLAHLGEPGGKIVENLKLKVVKLCLEELLGQSVVQADDCVGPEVESKIANLENGHILLLENVRFHQGEMENDPEFARQLASLGDLYINDAFDVCHRAQASVVGIPKFLPHGAGLQLQKEIEALSKVMQTPERPLAVVMGGAKVADKALMVDAFCAFADMVIVNGLIKQEIISKKISLTDPEKVFGPKQNLQAPDISEQDLKNVTEKISQAKTVVWNGPFGKFEEEQYAVGTRAIAKAIIENAVFSVVGGGDTVEFLQKEGMLDKFSHVSTGGGAMLEFLSGQELPGLKALQ